MVEVPPSWGRIAFAASLLVNVLAGVDFVNDWVDGNRAERRAETAEQRAAAAELRAAAAEARAAESTERAMVVEDLRLLDERIETRRRAVADGTVAAATSSSIARAAFERDEAVEAIAARNYTVARVHIAAAHAALDASLPDGSGYTSTPAPAALAVAGLLAVAAGARRRRKRRA